MTEVFFYHLQRQSLETALPKLLLRSRERGWKALVKAATPERVAALDAHLWTFSDESFLPHGRADEPEPAEQPVLLTHADGNPNGAEALFLVDAAAPPADLSPFARVLLLFDGNDPDAVEAGRRDYRALRAAGHELSYWQEDEGGGWRKRDG